ncbi:hypothetical protein ES702_02669 [subsurface metagenome]
MYLNEEEEEEGEGSEVVEEEYPRPDNRLRNPVGRITLSKKFLRRKKKKK